jgi:pyruvate dehydrogenase (quinone)
MARNASDVLVETLSAWGIDVIFGMPGDGINGIMEAIRTHEAMRFVQVRHEESAALMACAYAKFTGKLGCCLATTGPGGIHLLNGLYDAKADRAPVIAVTGLPYHDLTDTHTQQDVDHTRLFMDVAQYSARIMGAAQVENVVALACRTALAERGVAHVAIPTDVQEQKIEEAARSARNIKHHVSLAEADSRRLPSKDDIARAADILNAGKRVAILAGQGALGARDELIECAERLGAPVVKALLGKAVLPDAHPLTTGGIGLLGTRPSHEIMESCDTLLIVGSTFPYIEYYPDPEKVRGVQVDRDATRIGLRFPVEVGLAGDATCTLRLLNERLERKTDRSFLDDAQGKMREWRRLLSESAERPGRPMKPQKIAQALGEHLAPDAIVVCDSGHNTGLCARHVELTDAQAFGVSGHMATMACGIPYAIAASIAHPGRQVVAFVGDGGLSMLLGELVTITRYKLPIKIIVLKNNTLGQIKWEQMMFLGNPEYECDLEPIDFVKAADSMGIRGWTVDAAEDCLAVLRAAFAHKGAALVEAVVDPNEPLLPPKRVEKYAKNLEKALGSGTAGASDIARALKEEPARRMLQP